MGGRRFQISYKGQRLIVIESDREHSVFYCLYDW